jgi:hypothetical protein
VERKVAHRILEAVRNKIWKIGFKSFANGCSAKVERIYKVEGSAAPLARAAVGLGEADRVGREVADR